MNLPGAHARCHAGGLMDFCRPASLPDLFAALQGGARVLAGGTDVYPAAGGARIAGPVADIAALPGMAEITMGPQGLRIGACVTWSALADAALPDACAALQQAAVQVGGRQIQNTATLGGNLCNASPAADGMPPLLALEAEVELASAAGLRRLALRDFVLGPRKVALTPGEVLVAVHLPSAALTGRSAFEKLGARTYLVISIAMVAVRLTVTGGQITGAAVAIGACGPVARRMPPVEAALIGPVAGAADRARGADFSALSPIDDPRATADYRRHAAVELVGRAVARCL